MRLGVVTAMLRWLPGIESQLGWAKAAGFESVELSCWHTAPDGFDGLWARRRQSAAEVAGELAPALVGIAGRNVHASFFHAYDPTYCTFHPLFREAAIDEIGYALELAAAIGAGVVTCHPNGLIHGRGEAERRASFLDAVERLERMAAERGVRVGIEAIQYLLPLERCELLLDLGLEHVGLTIDLGHAHLRCGRPPLCMNPFEGRAYTAYGSVAAFIDRLLPLIVHVHLHDCDGDTSHLALGDGDAPLQACLDALVRNAYGGDLSIEAEGDERQQRAFLDTVRSWLAHA
jgi:sugar phosphate isomerase/epimerase